MPDVENKAAGQETDAGEKQPVGADQKPTTDAGTEDKGDDKDKGQGGDDTDTQKGDDVDKAKAPADTSKKDDKGDDEFKDDGKEPEVKPRMSSKDFIIKRQQRKIAKLKGKAGEESNEGGEDEGGDDEVAPEDEALINKVVAKTFAPIIDKTQSAEDNTEISEFLSVNPDFKPYEAKARRYIAHPSRRHLPVETVFYEVAGKDLMKIGAKRQKKADEEAKDSQTGGGSARGGEGAKTAWDMPKDEFEAKQEEIRRKGSA